MLLGGAASLALRSVVSGQGSPASTTSLTATALADNLTLFSGAGGNVVVAAGSASVWMVNGGLQERSAELLEAVADHARGKRIEGVINTDWHREHTGSNEHLGKSGATIIAHEHTKQYLGAEIYVDWQNQTYRPLPPDALPNRTFYTSGRLDVGSEQIMYAHLGQAHTDAAIYAFFPRANVLVAGDVLTVGKYPIADYTTGGWLGGLVAANKTLLELTNAQTRVVPGVGPVQTRDDLQAQHDMLAAMMERLTNMIRQGLGPEDIVAAAATKEYDAKWGNPDLFVSTSYRSLWLHVRELGKIV
jgi:cyclase